MGQRTGQQRRHIKLSLKKMSNKQNELPDRLAETYNLQDGELDEEADKEAREDTEDLLNKGFRQSRYEFGGVPIEIIAEIIFTHFDQSETKALIDRLVILYRKKYEETLFQ